MATIITKIVDPGNSPGTDYTSLDTCLSSNQQNLVNNDSILKVVLRCSNGQPYSRFAYAVSYTVDSTHYIEIEVDSEYRHSGVYPASDANIVRFETSSNNALYIAGSSYMRLSGIAVKITGTAVSGIRASTNSLVRDCLVAGESLTGSTPYGIYSSTVDNGIFINNIIYGIRGSSSGYGIYLTGCANSALLNNTIYNCGRGISTANYEVFLANNIVNNCTDNIYAGGGVTWGSTNNLTSAYEYFGTGTNYTGDAVFVNVSGLNFHLDQSDTLAIDMGADLSNNSYFPFNTDIDGQPRVSGSWDIGADEVSSSNDQNWESYDTCSGIEGTTLLDKNFGTLDSNSTATDTSVIQKNPIPFEGNITPTATKIFNEVGKEVNARVHGSLYYNGYIYGSTRSTVSGTSPASGAIVKINVNNYNDYTVVYPNADGVGYYDMNQMQIYNGTIYIIASGQKIIRLNPSTMAYDICLLWTDADSFVIDSDGYIYVQYANSVRKCDVDDLNVSTNPSLLQSYNLTPASQMRPHSYLVDNNYLYLNLSSSDGGVQTIEAKLLKLNKSDLSYVNQITIPKSTDDMTQNAEYVFLGIEEYSSSFYGWDDGAAAIRKSDMALFELPTLGLNDDGVSYGSVIFGSYLLSANTNDNIYIIDVSNPTTWSKSLGYGEKVLGKYSTDALLENNQAYNEILRDEDGNFHAFMWDSYNSSTPLEFIKFSITDFDFTTYPDIIELLYGSDVPTVTIEPRYIDLSLGSRGVQII